MSCSRTESGSIFFLALAGTTFILLIWEERVATLSLSQWRLEFGALLGLWQESFQPTKATDTALRWPIRRSCVLTINMINGTWVDQGEDIPISVPDSYILSDPALPHDRRTVATMSSSLGGTASYNSLSRSTQCVLRFWIFIFFLNIYKFWLLRDKKNTLRGEKT